MQNLVNKNKRYNTLDNYYKFKYNQKVFKIPLNGGFTCPNIDGKVGKRGCTFCSTEGSGEFCGKKYEPLEIQFQKGLEMMTKKWKEGLYIPYFQAFSNTYASLEYLKDLYEKALKLNDNIIGISIGTRPDCLPDNIVDYLGELNKNYPVQIELGLQTIHEETSIQINRCHNLKIFDDAVRRLRKHDIEVVVHIMNGLPGETKEMMLETVKHLNKLDIQGIKIHMLNILKNSVMGYKYFKNPWDLLTKDEYIDIVCDQILHLRKDIIIHRLTGDGKFDMLIAPEWIKKKFVVINDIDKKMRKLDMYQGDLYDENN